MNNKILYIGIILLIISLQACNQSSSESLSKKDAVLSVIHERKSVRNFVKDRPVSKEDIEMLLRAGMAAPSGKNVQAWEFVVIDDRSTLDKMAAELPTAKMLAEAPMAIVVCGDTVRQSYWYLDCAAATENILLAVEASGLGAVWTAAYPYRDRMNTVIKYTELPPQILPLVVIPVGHPMGKHSPKDKYDEKKVHMNKW
ncbi:nitroreductase family protein [Prevotella sp. 10(H)]|uniref:nitroreductase family protein n=1 Tax=Prevotella sp. 10(H) TaxID=1158294 RepID=UPI0004A70E5F|nr:nitroreductase family protein [Prevotella sp. 10(H)]